MATPGSLEDHSICRPRSTLPLPSVSVAWSLVVSLTARLTLAGVTPTAPPGTGVAVAGNLAGSAGAPRVPLANPPYSPRARGGPDRSCPRIPHHAITCHLPPTSSTT